MRSRMGVVGVAAVIWPVAGFSLAPALLAQQLPVKARELVVRIHPVYIAEARTPPVIGTGTGFVIADDGEQVYIATAAHNFRHLDGTGQPMKPQSIRLAFAPDSVRSKSDTTLPEGDEIWRPDDDFDGLDFAVVAVPRANIPQSLLPFELDRIGSAGERDRVVALGCARAESGNGCWREPGIPDVVEIVDDEIRFSTTLTDKGHSGGALFNRHGEVVGMITQIESRLGVALNSAILIDSLAVWSRPEAQSTEWVQLREATVPRGGHEVAAGVMLLSPTGQGPITSPSGQQDLNGLLEGRPPSARVTFERRASRQDATWLSWHLAGLRLAPDNIAVHAGLVGFGARWTYSLGELGIGVTGFGELGLGTVATRWDAGGYFVVDPAAGSAYQPLWDRSTSRGLIAGFGGRLELVARRWLIFDLMIGNWSYELPDDAPDSQSYVWGFGVRGWP